MAKRTIKINLKLPAGVAATKELTDKVTAAAQTVIDAAVGEVAEAQKLAKELKARGVTITAEELLNRMEPKKGRGRPAKKANAATKTTGARKRVVLSPAQRKALIAELKAGAKISAAAKSYGISTATVMNIKTAAGLTKKRK